MIIVSSSLYFLAKGGPLSTVSNPLCPPKPYTEGNTIVQQHFKCPAAYNMCRVSSTSFRHLPHGVQMNNITRSYLSLNDRCECIRVLLFRDFVREDQYVSVKSFMCDLHFVGLDARLELSVLSPLR